MPGLQWTAPFSTEEVFVCVLPRVLDIVLLPWGKNYLWICSKSSAEPNILNDYEDVHKTGRGDFPPCNACHFSILLQLQMKNKTFNQLSFPFVLKEKKYVWKDINVSLVVCEELLSGKEDDNVNDEFTEETHLVKQIAIFCFKSCKRGWGTPIIIMYQPERYFTGSQTSY